MSGWDSDYRYEPSPLFQQIFRCLPFEAYKNPELESGNKIIMPPSSLSLLIQRRVRSPFFFKIEGYNSDKTSHCGVLEFCADEGCIHMPRGMMKSLSIEEGDRVILRDAVLSKGNYMKLQPHRAAFVELPHLKPVLEAALRGFSCLSSGDTIAVRCFGEDFYLDVVEVGPGGEAISLIDTDCTTDFAPPLDYVEPAREEKIKERGDRGGEREEEAVFRPFVGVARRLDGTVMVESSGCAPVAAEKEKREKDGGKEFKPFMGTGRVLGGPSCFGF